MWRNSDFCVPADLVTFTGGNLNEKLCFLCIIKIKTVNYKRLYTKERFYAAPRGSQVTNITESCTVQKISNINAYGFGKFW